MAFDGFVERRLRNLRSIDRADLQLPHPLITPRPISQIKVRRALRGVTHLLNECNESLVFNTRKRLFTDELSEYRNRGIEVGIIFHGSDARDPDLSMELNEHSYFKVAHADWVDQRRRTSKWRREAALASGVPLFVTTPDLLDHVPAATLLPLTVDALRWALPRDPFTHHRPRVLHRPSSAITKGTEIVVPVLEELERAGRIDVVRSSSVSRGSMHELLSESDIVVDQLRVGAYGVSAVEAMAAGRLVIANVSSSSRVAMGGEVPIVNATPSDFSNVMEGVLADLKSASVLAAKGPAFVRDWHDGRKAAGVISEFLGC